MRQVLRDGRSHHETAPPLFHLPTEIRNCIYELVVVYKGNGPNVNPVFPERSNHPKTAVQPALARVCRQLRAEVLHIFYGQNTFVYHMKLQCRIGQGDIYCRIKGFVERLRKSSIIKHRMIRHMLLCIDTSEAIIEDGYIQKMFCTCTKHQDVAGLVWAGELHTKKPRGHAAPCSNKHFLLDASPFRLLDLPAELRHKIYGFAVASKRAFSILRPVVPALSHVSRQLRRETLPIFHGGNRFSFHMTSGWEDLDCELDHFVRTLRAFVRHRQQLVGQVILAINGAGYGGCTNDQVASAYAKATGGVNVGGLAWRGRIKLGAELLVRGGWIKMGAELCGTEEERCTYMHFLLSK